MWRYLVKAVRGCGRVSARADPASYRPDLHYMRGPGPKWHAKYGNLAPRISSGGPTTEPTLPGAAKLTPRPRSVTERPSLNAANAPGRLFRGPPTGGTTSG